MGAAGPEPEEAPAELGVTREAEVWLAGQEEPVVVKLPVASASRRIVRVVVPAEERRAGLGAVLEDDPERRLVFVADLEEDSPLRKAGARPGDVLRATSAAVQEMEYGAGNVLLGGIGRPTTKQVLFVVAVEDRWTPTTFPGALEALSSNRLVPSESLVLLLER